MAILDGLKDRRGVGDIDQIVPILDGLNDNRQNGLDSELNNDYEPIYVSVEGKPTVLVETQQGLAGKDGASGVAASAMQIVENIAFNSVNPIPVPEVTIHGKLFTVSFEVVTPFSQPISISIGKGSSPDNILPLGDYGFHEPVGTRISLDFGYQGVEINKGDFLQITKVSTDPQFAGRVNLVIQLVD